MQRNLEKLIRQRMGRFVARKTSLRDFNRWFVQAAWEIEEYPASLREFVYSAKAFFDDYDNKHLSIGALRHRLSLLFKFIPGPS